MNLTMKKIWYETAWNDYLYWQSQDRKTLRKINSLIQDVERNGYDGIGKPEPLKDDFSGWWGLRIDEKTVWYQNNRKHCRERVPQFGARFV